MNAECKITVYASAQIETIREANTIILHLAF